MVRIYGCSDDLVEIEDSKHGPDEIDCFDRDVRIWFADGTVIRIGYPKEGLAVWWIEVEQSGVAEQKLTIVEDPDAEIYSDIFEIDSEILITKVIPQKYERC